MRNCTCFFCYFKPDDKIYLGRLPLLLGRVCSLNHRGAESEELNWVFGCWEREVLACRVVCDVTCTSASHRPEVVNRFSARHPIRSSVSVSASMSTHTLTRCVRPSLSRASIFAQRTRTSYSRTTRRRTEWELVLPTTVTVWPKTGSDFVRYSHLFFSFLLFYVFQQTNVWHF